VSNQCFNLAIDIVQRIHALATRSKSWREEVALHLAKKGTALTFDQAKTLADVADELKLSCAELKDLRNAIRASRMWLNRVRKYNLENGDVSAEELESLLVEHSKLLIQMPEEADNLKQATKGFCLCRRPYVGFMIACDTCNEWYHGSCIGISETQADRYDTYTCVRCGVKRLFDQNVNNIVCVVKKWTSPVDLKKSRQMEYQRHQRKVRKEKKDIEKFESIVCELYAHMKVINNSDNHMIPSFTDLHNEQKPNEDEIQSNQICCVQSTTSSICRDTELNTSLEIQNNMNLDDCDNALKGGSCQYSTIKSADSEYNQSHSIYSSVIKSESQILHDSLRYVKVYSSVEEGKFWL
jgi:hypothetical protein